MIEFLIAHLIMSGVLVVMSALMLVVFDYWEDEPEKRKAMYAMALSLVWLPTLVAASLWVLGKAALIIYETVRK